MVLSPDLGGLRMLDNLVGAAIGMVATFALWPSWEAHFLRHHLAEDLRGNARFLLTALDAWLGTATMREADNARRQAGLAGNNAEASLRRTLEEPRRYPPEQVAAAMAITAAARRLAGIAALIMQSPPVPEAMACIAGMRPNLQASAEDVAGAIEHGRTPAACYVRMLPDHSRIEGLLYGALRQLSVVADAARDLAACEPLLPSPHDSNERFL